MSVITVERKLLEKNDVIAAELRELFIRNNIYVINLISSPGSGKTSLIEKTVEYLKNDIKISVITGDLQTDNDAKRISSTGIPVVQIITNGACHLEANLIRNALENLEPENIDFLIIENVGNLVCPAGFDLGENEKIVLMSTTEGEDKPLKYPVVFKNSSVMVINKTDLLPYLNFSQELLEENAIKVNPHLKIFKSSCTTGEGIEKWCEWILHKCKK
jgi:hydrogenase nickel incorporation protein HypB